MRYRDSAAASTLVVEVIDGKPYHKHVIECQCSGCKNTIERGAGNTSGLPAVAIQKWLHAANWSGKIKNGVARFTCPNH